MSLKESLKKLNSHKLLSVRREVKKELAILSKNQGKPCIHCNTESATHFIKGSSNGYCRKCAKELFQSLAYLEKRK